MYARFRIIYLPQDVATQARAHAIAGGDPESRLWVAGARRGQGMPDQPGQTENSVLLQDVNDMDTITTTLKREWFAKIVARTKRIEYREINPYWTSRSSRASTPFRLVLRN